VLTEVIVHFLRRHKLQHRCLDLKRMCSCNWIHISHDTKCNF